MRERLIDRAQIHLHYLLAFLHVSFANRILDRLDRLLRRQDAGDGKEAGLHHGVDAAAHARFARNFARVDDEETSRAVQSNGCCTFCGKCCQTFC